MGTGRSEVKEEGPAKPGPEDIQAAMTNICRCGTYNAVAQAISIAVERL